MPYIRSFILSVCRPAQLPGQPDCQKAARRRFGDRVDPWDPVLFSAISVVTVLPLAALLAIFPGHVLYVIPAPWFWLFVFAQIVVGISSLRAFLDAPHRFLIRAQLAAPQSPDSFALAIRGIYCRVRDPFLLSGFLLIWLTPFMTENLLATYLLITVYLFLGTLHWESRAHHSVRPGISGLQERGSPNDTS